MHEVPKIFSPAQNLNLSMAMEGKWGGRCTHCYSLRASGGFLLGGGCCIILWKVEIWCPLLVIAANDLQPSKGLLTFAVPKSKSQLGCNSDKRNTRSRSLSLSHFTLCPQVNKVLRNHNIKPHWMFALDNIIRKAVQTAITILVPGNVVRPGSRLRLNTLRGELSAWRTQLVARCHIRPKQSKSSPMYKNTDGSHN